MAKVRLDILLVEKGLAPSRQKAAALIMTGDVLVDDRVVDKPGHSVKPEAVVRVRGEQSQFVGRGGDKLNPALDHFLVNLLDKVAIDIGSSTGGFTDCMLSKGAKLVYAVDVGTAQLAHRLRIDPRVVVMEQTHVARLTANMFDPRPGLATIDLSFIGVRKVLANIVGLLLEPFEIIALVKPQFELGPEAVSKGGVVRDETLQLQAVELVTQLGHQLGLNSKGYVASSLKGQKKGNQEYFVHFWR